MAAFQTKKPIMYGLKVVFGIPKERKPIIGLPKGRLKLALRRRRVGRAHVRTETHIENFVLLDNGETWGLLKQARLERWHLGQSRRQPD